MPKIVQYNLPPGGTVIDLADNNSTALEIEGVDSKDYIVVDTTDGNEVLNLSAGGATGQRFQVRPTYVTYAASGSVALMQTGATSTTPNVLPNVSDSDTGIGRAADDALSLIAGGVEVARCVTTNADAEFLMADEVGFINDPDLMMRRKSTNSLEFRVAGTDILGIDGSGAYVENGKFGVGTLSPSAPIHIVDDTQNTQLLIDRSTGQFKIEQNTANTTAQSNVNLRLASGNTVRVMLLSGGNVGVGTTAPGQIFDVNQGSGNMIADGYDTHSLASYKENLSPADSGYLAKVTACPPKQWTSVPYVSADEIKAATIEQFGQDAWDGYFPEDDSHRAGALLSMPEGEMKAWIDAWAESKREERRPEEKWQQVRLGLVADADDTAANFPESVSKNADGEISGINTMSYIGTLHAALVELAAKVEALEGGD